MYISVPRNYLSHTRCSPTLSLPSRIRKNPLRALASFVPEAANVGAVRTPLTGHIDFLQVRNGCVHVLDYKPDARTNRPIAQLAIYALALTRRIPGLKLFDIKCAWFNEHEYCEMFPRTLFLKR